MAPLTISPSKRRKHQDLAGAMFTGRGVAPLPPSSSLFSSSPAFATPIHPIKPFVVPVPAAFRQPAQLQQSAAVLPILLPAATLRPLAFRTFTKKHSLTLTSTALQELARFVGRHCGSGWREEGLAEKVLEEVARSWKGRNGGAIVDGASPELKEILKALEDNMSGGRIVATGGGRGLSRQNSLMVSDEPSDMSKTRLGLRPTAGLTREESTASFGMSGLAVEEEQEDGAIHDARGWLKVISALDQPRFTYNVDKRYFERDSWKPSLLPPAAHRTRLFRNRYNVIHQRLLRNESFQASAIAATRAPALRKAESGIQTHKITPIANLLGRHGTHHMILGMLVVLPTSHLALSDLTGTIKLDISHAVTVPEDSSWFTPGMIILVDGVYEEDEEDSTGKGLSGSTGVGGTIGGRFQGFYIGQPPCERRKVTMGVSSLDGSGQDHTVGGGFGWIDFLGVGSERACGQRMRRIEERLLRKEGDIQDPPSRGRIIILGELNLDQPRCLLALRKILAGYAAEAEGSLPMSFVLAGNFTEHAVMARGGSGGSVEYKEYLDSLAAVLGDFPTLLSSATFVFVPGDNDGWVSSFTAGSAVPLPRKAIPDMFTSRIRRTFAQANADAGKASGDKDTAGEAVFTTNPARLSLFGPTHELVVFRDDLSARLRRAAVRPKSKKAIQKERETEPEGAADEAPTGSVEDAMIIDEASAESLTTEEDVSHSTLVSRKLVKTILDQGYLAPFRQSSRPVHWDYASALHLYPLPTSLVLVDTSTAAFCVTYEGCHVMNPGSLLVSGRRGVGRWIEYQIGGAGKIRECLF